MNIEDVGRRRCDDRGGAIHGKRLDLFIPTLQEALEFGRRRLDVEVLRR
ncbi:3D domain-containing protein [Caenibacillus caldisaponilyticus]|nr:3D domain-containing protein [Caenibacillus caldisaponilyticus]